jgi:hypothetical protein
MNTQTQAARQPVQAWKSRNLDVSLWETTNDHGTFYSVKAVHRFKRTDTNQWDESSSFDYGELPLLVEFLGEAFKSAMKADLVSRHAKKVAAGVIL